METKLQVLMELHPCFHGFAGIPQETRLLFSYFLNLPTVHCTGLIDSHLALGQSQQQLTTPKNRHEKISEISNFIISTVEMPAGTVPDKVRAAATLLLVSIKNLLGYSIPMGYLNCKGFEDFFWERFFAKTLTTHEFTNITNALFRSLGFSRHTLNMVRCGNIYPKINTKGYDVFIAQTPFPGRVAKNTQLVVRYHDAVPLFTPHLINQPKSHKATHYRALCSNAKKAIFVCTSNAVRNDLLQVFPKLENRSLVIHDTISPNYYEEMADSHHITQIIRNYSYESRRYLLAAEDKDEEFYQKHLQEPFAYILMVSTIEPRKNHIRLIQAWEKVCIRLKINLKLVLVGELGWQVEPILAAMKPWQHRGQLFHLQKVPVDSLRLLYQGAACVVCPSVKEGFDLSGIEAMACGGKVVASDISVHREIYGEAAAYFEPYSVSSQTEAIESVVKPNSMWTSLLRERGLRQAQQYQRAAIESQWERFFEDLRRNKKPIKLLS